VAAGHIGTDEYIQYACIGDTTNVSSRVCGCAEEGQIVVTAATRDRLTRDEFPLRELPPATVKGKDEPLKLYLVDWR
jgi:adenylate cyclase